MLYIADCNLKSIVTTVTQRKMVEMATETTTESPELHC